MILYKHLPVVCDEKDSDEIRELNIKRCEAIRDNKFWFSKPANLNDPFDCVPLFHRVKTFDDVKAIIGDLHDDEADLLRESFPRANNKEEVLETYRSCFSKTYDETIIRSISLIQLENFTRQLVKLKMSNVGILSFTESYQSCLMWAHYSSNHKGICLEIEVPENAHGLNKVTYSKTQPKIALHEAMDQRHGKLENLFYYKSYPWRYEKEWRLVSLEGNKLSSIENSKIRKIHYGLNTSDRTKDFIESIVGSLIEINQVKLEPNYSIS